MTDLFKKKCSYGLMLLVCFGMQAPFARAEFSQLSEVFGEVSGGYYLKDSFHLSLKPDHTQRMLELFEFSPRGWTLVKDSSELQGDVTHFSLSLSPDVSTSEDESQTQDVSSFEEASGDQFLDACSHESSSHQGLWGYWGKAKGMISGAKNLACSAAKSMGGYALHALTTRTMGGSITQEVTHCPIPYVSQGTRLIFNLENSDALVSSLVSQVSLKICHDDRAWNETKKIKVRVRFEIDPGVAYSSLVQPEAAVKNSEAFLMSWLRSFQALIDENEIKLVHDQYSADSVSNSRVESFNLNADI